MDEPYDPSVPKSERAEQRKPYNEQLEVVKQKLLNVNPTTIFKGDASLIKSELGDDANPNSLYKIVQTYPSIKLMEIDLSEEKLKSDESVNKILLDYTSEKTSIL
jgi:hypothetical protein